MKTKVIAINTSAKMILKLTKYLEKNEYSSVLLVSDTTIFSLFGKNLEQQIAALGYHINTILLPNGEKSKTLKSAAMCWAKMQELGIDRKSLLIALGGGAITDSAGFIASCYMRGIDTLYLPTTLLGMVDASIGGKTAINLDSHKNLLGTLHHPKLVVMNIEYLKQLPERDFRSGLAEVIKHAVICDENFFFGLENLMEEILQKVTGALNYIIKQSTKIKMNIVKEDEHDHKERAFLNLGHTFAHAIESATNFEKYLHGEAVAIGMSCAAYISLHLNKVSTDFIKRQDNLLKTAGLPIDLPDIPDTDLLRLMKKDKKSVSGHVALILPERIGKVCKVNDIDDAIILQALHKKRSLQSQN